MKKLSIIFFALVCALSSLNLRAQTTMDLLCAPKMWSEKNPVGSLWNFEIYSRTHVIDGRKMDGKITTVKFPFYLSDTPDEVFDHSKVGKSNNGRYIVWGLNNDVADVNEIISIDAEKMTTFYDSKGRNIPSQSYYTQYAHQTNPMPDRKIFEPYSSGRGKYTFVGGDHYVQQYDSRRPEKLVYDVLPGRVSNGYEVAIGYYLSATNGSVTGYDFDAVQIRHRGNSWYSWQILTQYKSWDGFSRITAGRDEYLSKFAPLSKNGYYIEVWCGYSQFLIFLKSEYNGGIPWLHIVAITTDDAKFVYSCATSVYSIDTTPGKFRIKTSRGEIYESGGALYLYE